MVSSRPGVLSRLKQKPAIIGEGDRRYDGEESRAFVELVKANRHHEIISIECAVIGKIENIFDYLHMLYMADLIELKAQVAKFTGKAAKKPKRNINMKRRTYTKSIEKRAIQLVSMLATVNILYSDTVQLPAVARDADFYNAVGNLVADLQNLIAERKEHNGLNPAALQPAWGTDIGFLMDIKTATGDRLRQLHGELIPGFEECRAIWAFKYESAASVLIDAKRRYEEMKNAVVIP